MGVGPGCLRIFGYIGFPPLHRLVLLNLILCPLYHFQNKKEYSLRVFLNFVYIIEEMVEVVKNKWEVNSKIQFLLIIFRLDIGSNRFIDRF